MKSDARVRYTKMTIKKAILDLLIDKPIRKITVKEICDLAMINRATFYSHYRDAYDLLEQIQTEMYNEFKVALSSPDKSNINNVAEEILSLVNKNVELYKILLSENGDKMFLKRIADIGQKSTFSELKKQYPEANDKQLHLIYSYITHGSLAVIQDWVNSGMQESTQEISSIVNSITRGAITALK